MTRLYNFHINLPCAFLLSAFLLCYPMGVEADCKRTHTLLFCRNTLPPLSMLKQSTDVTNLIIQNFSGFLQLASTPDTKMTSLSTIQIQMSRIDGIEEGFFSKNFGNKLTEIRLNINNGTFNLDEHTLLGLNNTLEILHVSDWPVGSTSYLHQLKSLKALNLVKVGLTSLPDNLPRLLERLTKLDLSNNYLTTLPWDAVAKSIQSGHMQQISLGGNKWVCDCSFLPMINLSLKEKEVVKKFHCSNIPQAYNLNLGSLRMEDICPEGPLQPLQPNKGSPMQPVKQELDSVATPETSGAALKSEDYNKHVDGSEDEPLIATAGGVSTEVIAVIVAVVFVFILVLIAAIVFKVRSNRQKRRQQTAPKQPSHKSSAYCSVIEHSGSKPNSGSRTHGAPTYGRDMDTSESQPLAPSYYGNQDNRL